MLEQFKNYIAEHQLLQPEDKVILALSGGVDSVVLMHLLHRANHKFLVAHCNFNLRGEESDEDEHFACQFAMRYKVPFFCRHFDTQTHAKKHQLSIQESARNLRYAWFDRLRKSNDYQYVVTAHHAEDHAETIIYNLAKGTGIAGLHGILPKHNKIVRPLLFATKSQIIKYALDHQLKWREDASNQEDKYARNYIRWHIIPKLRHINPNFEKTLLQTSEKIGAVEQVFYQYLTELDKKLIHKSDDITLLNYQPLLHTQEPVIKLFYLLRKFNFNYTQAKAIHKILTKQSGKKIESSTHTLTNSNRLLVITPKTKSEVVDYLIEENQKEFYFNNAKICFQKIAYTDNISFPTSEDSAFIDQQKLVFPLTLRSWKVGDKFQPLGMKGMKKISDFLTDRKIPINLKAQVFVLCSEEKIVWVVGMRLDERFKVTSQTQQILHVKLG